MSEVINLNKARKQKQRADAEQLAVLNRARFGRTKAQKQREAADAAESKRRLDLLKRED